MMGFNPSEPRDKNGEWTSGGGAGEISLPRHAVIDKRVGELKDILQKSKDDRSLSTAHWDAASKFHREIREAHARFKAATGAPDHIPMAPGGIRVSQDFMKEQKLKAASIRYGNLPSRSEKLGFPPKGRR